MTTININLSNGAFIYSFGAQKGNQKASPRWCCIFTWRRHKYNMFSHHFQMTILNGWKIILKNWMRILFLTHQITIIALIFPRGFTYLENRIHLWALLFRSHNFLVWNMFLKCISKENENEYQITERGFSHNKPFYNNLFQFIHRCHIFGEPNPSLSPCFQQSGPIFMAGSFRNCL